MRSIDFRTSTRRRQCSAPPPSPAGCPPGAAVVSVQPAYAVPHRGGGPAESGAGLSMTGCRRPAPCAVWRYCRTVRWLCGAGIRRRGGVRPPLWGPGRRPPASEPVLHLRCVALSDEDPEHRPELYPGRSGDRPSRTGYHTEAGGGDGALRPAARAAGGLCANGPVPGTGRSRST